MKTNFKHNVAAVAVAVTIFNFSSCTYPDGPSISLRTKTARLTGEWEVQTIGGEDATDAEYTLEFEKGGDGTLSAFGYDTDFEWEWEDGKEAITLTIEDEAYEFEILRLTNKELIWEDPDGEEWEMEKK